MTSQRSSPDSSRSILSCFLSLYLPLPPSYLCHVKALRVLNLVSSSSRCPVLSPVSDGHVPVCSSSSWSHRGHGEQRVVDLLPVRRPGAVGQQLLDGHPVVEDAAVPLLRGLLLAQKQDVVFLSWGKLDFGASCW